MHAPSVCNIIGDIKYNGAVSYPENYPRNNYQEFVITQQAGEYIVLHTCSVYIITYIFLFILHFIDLITCTYIH